MKKSHEPFSPKENLYVQAFVDLGMRPSRARILVYLITRECGSSQDIEDCTRLRQPDVSIAMQYFLGQGWVSCQEKRENTVRQRPRKVYSLKIPAEQILREMEETIRKNAEMHFVLIREIRDGR